MAKAASLDSRVRKETIALVAQAKALLAGKTRHESHAKLTAVMERAQHALAANDVAQLRNVLPALDALVDQVAPVSGKSAGLEYFESIAVAIVIALLLRAFVVEAFKIPSSSMYPALEIGDHIFVNKLVYGMRMPFTGKKLFTTRSPHRGEVGVFIQPCNDNKDYIKRIIAVAGDTVEVRCDILYINGHAMPHLAVPGECSYEDLSGSEWYTQRCNKFASQIGEFDFYVYQRGEIGTQDFPTRDRIPPSCSEYHRKEPEVRAKGVGADWVGPDSASQATGKVVVTDEYAPACAQQAHYVVPPGHVFAMGDNRDNSRDSRSWGAVPVDNMKGKATFIWLSFKEWGWTPMSWRTDRMGNFVH